MSGMKIKVFGTWWCGDCLRTRRFLDKNKINFQWVNIDEDKDGEQLVNKINKGMRRVPTIIFEDGTVMVEPTIATLARKLDVNT